MTGPLEGIGNTNQTNELSSDEIENRIKNDDGKKEKLKEVLRDPTDSGGNRLVL